MTIKAVEKSNQEKMEELKQRVGKAFFDYGRIKYEIEVKEKDLGNISVNIHNMNLECLKLEEAIHREAQIAAMDIKLAGAPSDEPAAVTPEIPGQ